MFRNINPRAKAGYAQTFQPYDPNPIFDAYDNKRAEMQQQEFLQQQQKRAQVKEAAGTFASGSPMSEMGWSAYMWEEATRESQESWGRVFDLQRQITLTEDLDKIFELRGEKAIELEQIRDRETSIKNAVLLSNEYQKYFNDAKQLYDKDSQKYTPDSRLVLDAVRNPIGNIDNPRFAYLQEFIESNQERYDSLSTPEKNVFLAGEIINKEGASLIHENVDWAKFQENTFNFLKSNMTQIGGGSPVSYSDGVYFYNTKGEQIASEEQFVNIVLTRLLSNQHELNHIKQNSQRYLGEDLTNKDLDTVLDFLQNEDAGRKFIKEQLFPPEWRTGTGTSFRADSGRGGGRGTQGYYGVVGGSVPAVRESGDNFTPNPVQVKTAGVYGNTTVPNIISTEWRGEIVSTPSAIVAKDKPNLSIGLFVNAEILDSFMQNTPSGRIAGHERVIRALKGKQKFKDFWNKQITDEHLRLLFTPEYDEIRSSLNFEAIVTGQGESVSEGGDKQTLTYTALATDFPFQPKDIPLHNSIQSAAHTVNQSEFWSVLEDDKYSNIRTDSRHISNMSQLVVLANGEAQAIIKAYHIAISEGRRPQETFQAIKAAIEKAR